MYPPPPHPPHDDGDGQPADDPAARTPVAKRHGYGPPPPPRGGDDEAGGGSGGPGGGSGNRSPVFALWGAHFRDEARHATGGGANASGPPSDNGSGGKPPAGSFPRRGDGNEYRPGQGESSSKEADKINAGNWPASLSAYRQWRLVLVGEVVAASARPDEAFTCITAVNDGAPQGSFADSNYPWPYPVGSETLGAKLSSALSRIVIS